MTLEELYKYMQRACFMQHVERMLLARVDLVNYCLPHFGNCIHCPWTMTLRDSGGMFTSW